MSNQYYRTRYRCSNDCQMAGCPGHELVLHVANTSGTVSIEVDGESRGVFDDNLWCAMMTLAEQLPEHSFWPGDKK